jgi:hypothetical protein
VIALQSALADTVAFRATNAAAAALYFLVIALVREIGQVGIVLALTAGVSGVTCNKPLDKLSVKSLVRPIFVGAVTALPETSMIKLES